MIINFSILFYAVVFFAGLQITSHWQGFVFYSLAVLLVLTTLAARNLTKKWLPVFIPVLFIVSSLALLYLIDSGIEKQIFNFLSSVIYYLTLLGIYRLSDKPKDQTAKAMLAAGATSTMFFFYAASYGIYLNFMIPLWQLMLFYLTVTFFVSYQYFRAIDIEKKKSSFNYSFLLGFVMMEIAWMINFWPFGYLTTGVILLIFYYILWDLTQSYFLDLLSKKRVIVNIIFFGFLIGSILSSSKWFPNL